MIIVLIRTLVLFIIMFFTMKMMGKRYIAQLEPYEFVVSIMIAELATLPLEDTSIPLLYGAICILTILFIEFILSQLQLKNIPLRKFFGGTSIILIENGKFIKKNLEQEKLTINDILEELRSNGNYELEKIAFALLESNGKITVIPKDTNNQKVYLPTSIIIDGEIDKNGLKYINRNTDWLEKQLKKHKIKSTKDIFYAYTDSQGVFQYQLNWNLGRYH